MAQRIIRPGAGRLWWDNVNRNFTELYAGMKITQAEAEILSTYGDTVSVADKAKSLLKFGKNADVDTAWVTVWDFDQDETYVTTNAIDRIVSSSAGDTEEIYVEGHTVSGTGADAQFTFTTQLVTLTGQTAATLTTPLARVSRMYVNSSTAVAGTVYAYQNSTITSGVPNDATKVHCTIDGANGETQSFKCATTFSDSDYAIVTGGYAALDKKTTAAVDLEIQVRPVGGVFRPAGGRIALSTNGTTTAQIQFDPYVIVPKNADIRIRAIASTTNVDVDASFQCYLAVVV